MRKHIADFLEGKIELSRPYQSLNNMLKSCLILVASLSVCLAAKDCFYCESASSRDCKLESLNCSSLQYVTKGSHSFVDFKCVTVDVTYAGAKSHIRTCVGLSSKSELACSNVKNGLSDGQRLENCHECSSDLCNASSPKFASSIVLFTILSLTLTLL
ncbi:PREDICTED: uncharacterized protein LOC108561144 [Nicrophorus vespilloides]|uniref:Uncharacterized protein LOC108561144 n=1 Tax=Nicrophorus vespilloides TaxID=110193 RepID=A0ABM1MIP6_NICVS|nr:PREDICTED: uncharacterized protein LOC108561144 [Nicrophorus vespilloides]